jgi:hypothetical protein
MDEGEPKTPSEGEPMTGRYCMKINAVNHVNREDSTYAHCSMLAKARSVTSLLFCLPALIALRLHDTSLGGISGGFGAFFRLSPTDLSSPVWKSSTARRVLSTYSGL